MRALRKNHQGITIIEFTIVANAMFLMLFGIMEMGKFMFSLEMLNEITRKAARLATVCFIVDGSTIKTTGFGSTFKAPLVDLESLVLEINYLDESGSVVGSPTSEAGFSSIRYAQAEISGFSYSFSMLNGLLGNVTNIEGFKTTLPAESLGVYRPYIDDGGSYVSSPSNMNCQN